MAAPSIQWLKYLSATDPGVSTSELTLGTVTAGAWGPVKVVTFIPSGQIDNAKFWLYDSYAAYSGGGNVSLGMVSRTWWFKGETTSAISAGLFSKTGLSVGSTLACDYHPSLTSAGAGLSLGTVSAAATSGFIVVSPQPASNAYEGTYTDFAFQLSYDFV